MKEIWTVIITFEKMLYFYTAIFKQKVMFIINS